MNENLAKLLKMVGEDPELQKKFNGAESVEAVYEIAQTLQSGYTLEEFKEAVTQLKKLQDGELSESDLEAVAGGKSYREYTKTEIGEQILSWATFGIA